jgi:hypothetical protein
VQLRRVAVADLGVIPVIVRSDRRAGCVKQDQPRIRRRGEIQRAIHAGASNDVQQRLAVQRDVPVDERVVGRHRHRPAIGSGRVDRPDQGDQIRRR